MSSRWKLSFTTSLGRSGSALATFGLGAIILTLAIGPSAQGDDSAGSSGVAIPPAASSGGGSRPTPENIESWIRDLDSEKFAVRELATNRLTAAGDVA